LPRKTLVAGVVDGRNVWRADRRRAKAVCASVLGLVDRLVVSTSCPLLHVPLDLDAETSLDPGVRERLAFARQKVAEVVALGRALSEDAPPAGEAPAPAAGKVDASVRERLGSLGDARRAHRPARITEEEYERAMKDEIARVIALQEELGLDVLVHGEPERNDMVQYFAEQLDGYAATEHGWVQSYGTRYVRPPILHSDVARPRPMTVQWATYAQSLTSRPVKGMLTGPVTMLAWSFVRDDQPLAETARQVALALCDEIADLEAAGIRIIQVDEPALREMLPLRDADRPAYLEWAVGAFRLATSGVADTTQIHTHMCYSEFGEIIGAIGELDADVT